MRVAVVGAGLAGALLALRLRERTRAPRVDIFADGVARGDDATCASGGLVRGFETDLQTCRDACASLTEIQASALLREWADYREVGSVYLLAPVADPAPSLATVDAFLPGSAQLLARRALVRRYPFRGLPAGTVGVVERRAGYLSPARLRAGVLSHLATAGVTVRRLPVRAVTAGPAVRTDDGGTTTYDVVVVAAGAWTPRLLLDSGLDPAGLRTKQIQYSVHRVGPLGLGTFVDETTGLYGRPVAPDSFLLGLPSDRWDVDPAAVRPDPALADEVVACTTRRLGVALAARPPARVVASFDCYHNPPGLALRRCGDGGLYTFTGGSGGAAKTAVAASRAAAAVLLAG